MKILDLGWCSLTKCFLLIPEHLVRSISRFLADNYDSAVHRYYLGEVSWLSECLYISLSLFSLNYSFLYTFIRASVIRLTKISSTSSSLPILKFPEHYFDFIKINMPHRWVVFTKFIISGFLIILIWSKFLIVISSIKTDYRFIHCMIHRYYC
jgi:hypothetical protein